MNKTLSIKEIEAVLKQLRKQPYSYYWSAVIGVMVYAGLQESEVIELLSEDVDLKAGLITVRSSEKSANDRQVQISDVLLPLLENAPTSRSEYLFPNIEANSKQWYASSFTLELKKRLPSNLKPSNLSDSFGTL